MNWNENKTGAGLEPVIDAMLEDALKNFRESVHAWSDAAYSRPRGDVRVTVRSGWRLATAWALGCVLAVGSLSGAVYERHHRQVLAAQAREVQQARARQMVAEQRAQMADADLLATVDSDVSRTVPAAMEPLAQLMDEGESQ
jgi:hypothetical protein